MSRIHDNPTKTPSVTVVMVPREKFSGSRLSLEALYESAEYPFDLVFVDANSPPPVRDYLLAKSTELGFRLIRTERFLSPNQARNIGMRDVDADFVVFLDTDCIGLPGWLRALVSCALETGAAVVAPLLFEGAIGSRLIHTTAIDARIAETDGVRVFESDLKYAEQTFGELDVELERVATEGVEMHCVLFSHAIMQRLGDFDEGLLSLMEESDVSLQVREAGATMYMEPSAKALYWRDTTDRFDLAYAKLRWSEEWNRASVDHFAKKWSLDPSWGDETIAWANAHLKGLKQLSNRPTNIAARYLRIVLRRLSSEKQYSRLRALRSS